jgi:hypothetical protein
MLANLKIFISLATFGFGLQGTAVELRAADIEKKLQKYTQLDRFKAHFEQITQLKEVGISLRSEGELTVIRPSQVVWRIFKPAPLELTLEGTLISVVQGEGSSRKQQQWQMDKLGSDRDLKGMNDLMAWLKLDAKAIASSYRLDEIKPNEFLCTPRQIVKQSPFKAMRMFLGPQGFLVKLILEENSGDQLEISFSLPQKV